MAKFGKISITLGWCEIVHDNNEIRIFIGDLQGYLNITKS